MIKVIKISILRELGANNLNSDKSGEVKQMIINNTVVRRIASQCLERGIKESFREENLDNDYIASCNTRYAAEFIINEIITKKKESDEENIKKIKETVDTVMKNVFYAKKSSKKDDDVATGKNAIKFSKMDLYNLSKMMEELIYSGVSKNDCVDFVKKNFKDCVSIEDAFNGKMNTNDYIRNVDSCIHCAHARGIYPFIRQSDTFTALDDLASFIGKEIGSAIIDEKSFDSGTTLFQTMAIDLDQLKRNLKLNNDKKFEEMFVKDNILYSYLEECIMSFPKNAQHSYLCAPRPALISIELLNTKRFNTDDNAFNDLKRDDALSDISNGIKKYVDFLNAADRQYELAGERFFFTFPTAEYRPNNCTVYENFKELLSDICSKTDDCFKE